MNRENKTPVFIRNVSTESEARPVRCRCRLGHPFFFELFTTINLSTDKNVTEYIDETGLQNGRCPVCGIPVQLAESIVLHDPSRQEVALIIPEVLSHLELSITAEFLQEIASSSPLDIPAYFADFQTMVGTDKLPSWIRGEPVSKNRYEAVSNTSAPPPDSLGLPYRDGVDIPRHPEIHEAFADLAAEEKPSGPVTLNSKERDGKGGNDWPYTPNSKTKSRSIPSGYSHSIQEAFRASMESGAADHKNSEDAANYLATPSAHHSTHNGSSYRPIHSVPIAAKEAFFDIEGNNVVLIHRMPSTSNASFHPKRADLWFQLHTVAGYPLVVMTLVADPWRLDSPFLYWIVDVNREAHREVADRLQKEYRAEVRLYTPDLTEAERFSTEAPRENNVAEIMERASQLLSQKPSISFDKAADLFAKDEENLLGDRIPPFRYYDISTVANFDVTYSRLERLAHWLVPKRYEYLVNIRSFPLQRLETKIKETLKASLDLGVRIPDILKPRAIEFELARDDVDLLSKLSRSFENLIQSDNGPSREAACQNWRDLQEDFISAGLEADLHKWNRAGELLKVYGLHEQKEPNANP